MTKQIQLTSLDPDQLKQELISYLGSTGKFDDFNFEGSTISTIIDLLVRNTSFDTFMAHMVANESFLESAQIIGNVSSHAQKISYLPKSCRSAFATIKLRITPSDTTNLDQTIFVPKGITFASQYQGETFDFVSKDPFNLTLINGVYESDEIVIYQGSYLKNTINFDSDQPKLTIANQRIDTTTMNVSVSEGQDSTEYLYAPSIQIIANQKFVYFIGQYSNGLYYIEFGKNLLGKEPIDQSIVDIDYIVCETEHANGASTFFATTTIEDFSNIEIETITPALGGSDQETIDSIRFNAPRSYSTQERALTTKDFETLILSKNASVKSVRCWFVQSTVYFSVILEDDIVPTRSITDNIISTLNDYQIGSISLIHKNAQPIKLDFILEFSLDRTKTSSSTNTVFSELSQKVTSYVQNELTQFGKFYNKAQLISELWSTTKGLANLSITNILVQDIQVSRIPNIGYQVEFNNQIESIYMTGFEVDSNGTNHQLYSEDDNQIYLSYLKNGSTIISKVGQMDPIKGTVQFNINMIQQSDVVQLTATPTQNDIFVFNNQYLTLGLIE